MHFSSLEAAAPLDRTGDGISLQIYVSFMAMTIFTYALCRHVDVTA